MFTITHRAAILVAFALFTSSLFACNASTEDPPPASAPAIAVGIAPRSASATPGASVQFSAAVSGTTNLAVTWSVRESGACGSVNGSGLFVAPPADAVCHVVVTSQANPAASDTATVTVTAAGGTQAWRPFSATSPWNTPIPPNPELEPDSAALVQDFISSTTYGIHLDVNIPDYSIPLYWADASTPTYPVAAAIGGEGWSGYPATLDMPIPAGATPDVERDQHMLVIDRERGLEWGCYHMRYASGSWTGGLCATADLTSSGVRVPKPQASPWWLAHGARACGFPLVAGLIRIEEIEAGRIDHALVVAYPHIRKSVFTPPASTPSAIGAAAPLGVPCGGRFQFDPSVDVTTLGLSRSGQIIVRALQEYGAYVGDYSGALSLYAENSPAAQAYWASGVLGMYELQDKIDLTRLRVIKMGTMY